MNYTAEFNRDLARVKLQMITCDFQNNFQLTSANTSSIDDDKIRNKKEMFTFVFETEVHNIYFLLTVLKLFST